MELRWEKKHAPAVNIDEIAADQHSPLIMMDEVLDSEEAIAQFSKCHQVR